MCMTKQWQNAIINHTFWNCKMKIANSSNTNKHKAKAALANHSSGKHTPVSKEEAAKMHLAMKAACHMLSPQAVNLKNEGDPTKEHHMVQCRQWLILLLRMARCATTPNWISLGQNMGEQPVASILMQLQMSANTEVSPLSSEEDTVVVEGLLSLSGAATSPTAITNLTSNTGWLRGTSIVEMLTNRKVIQECISAIVIQYNIEEQ